MFDLFPQTAEADDLAFIDGFAGGGGASTGIEMATGKSPTIAINHCHSAIAMHAANHPDTIHVHSDVWALDIKSYTNGRQTWGMWLSPDCTHFSRARGSKPTSKRVRGLAWISVEYCQKLGPKRPFVIFLENVEEFLTWEDFPAWKAAMERLGYRLEWRVLRASDYGAPTIRKRLVIIMRRDGKKIRWPDATHGDPNAKGFEASGLKPWRTAAEIIDWSQPCHSIFMGKEEGRALGIKRPLVENTLKRIAAGIKRYVIDAKQPFILNMSHGGRLEPLDQPARTIMTEKGGSRALVVPTMVQTGYGEREGQKPRALDLHKPLGTVVAGGAKHALVTAFMAQHNLGVVGRPMTEPVSTITTRGTQTQLVTSNLISLRGTREAQLDKTALPIDAPLPTISAGGNHAAEVRAFLIKYYGAGIGQGADEPLHTVTTNDRFGLVTVDIGGEPYVITDIGMRMLTPRELYLAQGFPDDYKIDIEHNGKKLTKTEQIAKCGNSVCPPMAEAVVRANAGSYVQ